MQPASQPASQRPFVVLFKTAVVCCCFLPNTVWDLSSQPISQPAGESVSQPAGPFGPFLPAHGEVCTCGPGSLQSMSEYLVARIGQGGTR